MKPVEVPSVPVKKHTKDKEVKRDECINFLEKLPALQVDKTMLIDIINKFNEKELISMLTNYYKGEYSENIKVKCGTDIRKLYNDLTQ